jgi:hypothetical protein
MSINSGYLEKRFKREFETSSDGRRAHIHPSRFRACGTMQWTETSRPQYDRMDLILPSNKAVPILKNDVQKVTAIRPAVGWDRFVALGSHGRSSVTGASRNFAARLDRSCERGTPGPGSPIAAIA